VKEVEFNYDGMQQAAQSGFMNAWAAATYLVRRGVPFRRAHELIGKAVQLSMVRGCELKDLPFRQLQGLNPAFEQDFYSCLSLESVLAIHDVPGGTAPARVRQAIGEARQKIEAMREESHAHA
jgi:argininosuccinate lyase